MTIEIFMAMLFVVSVANSLITEAVKKCFDSFEKTYSSNIIAGIVSAAVGGFMCYWHFIYSGASETNEILILSYVSFVAVSWICAMVGYDKVVQAINQITGKWKA